jgi:TRAP-type C4-dicarboxylate transport system permease small subunit
MDSDKKTGNETPSRRALRVETWGLILVAFAILIVYALRYWLLVHRSTP